MVMLTDKSWLIQFGEATPRKIKFFEDQSFQLIEDSGQWVQKKRSLVLKGDFLPVEKLTFKERGDRYLCKSKPPILLYPGVDRSDLISALRDIDILSSELIESERIDDPLKKKIEAAKLLRKVFIHGGFYHLEKYFQSTLTSLILVNGRTSLIPSLELDRIFPIHWTDADNLPCEFEDSDAWFEFNLSLQGHIQQCHSRGKQLRQQIENGEPYDWLSGWPETRFPVDLLIQYFEAAPVVMEMEGEEEDDEDDDEEDDD